MAIARLAASNTVEAVFPSGSMDATGLLAASKTVEETKPNALVVVTGRLG